jgi:hypothetical protein
MVEETALDGMYLRCSKVNAQAKKQASGGVKLSVKCEERLCLIVLTLDEPRPTPR